jgi:hypothetical protein
VPRPHVLVVKEPAGHCGVHWAMVLLPLQVEPWQPVQGEVTYWLALGAGQVQSTVMGVPAPPLEQ